MSNAVIEKLKNSINKDCLAMFTEEEMKELRFLPINKQDETIYVGIVEAQNPEKRNPVLTKVVTITNFKPKIVPLTADQFEELSEHFFKKEELVLTAEKVDVSVFEEKLAVKTEIKEKEDENAPIALPVSAIKPVNLPFDPNAPKKRLGDQLIDDGLITREQLEEALFHSKQSGTPIGSVLVKLNFITVEQLRMALSKQQGINTVQSKDLEIDISVIKLLPEDFIKENKVVPIRSDGKTLFLGMVNPNDRQVLDDIIYLTGLKPYPLILTHIEYEKCIKNFFETVRATEKILQEINHEDSDIEEEDNLWDQFEKELEDESNIVAKFASSIITDAIDKKASDVHIEPMHDGYVVRYRTDGILQKVLEIPKKVESSVMSRLKVIAKLDIAEHRRPQDGHISLKYNDRTYDLRVSTLPVNQKEKMVVRILAPDIKVQKGDKLLKLTGASSEDIEKIQLMTKKPHGIILAVGPTGSGKTTTLYSILNQINNEMINITTVEDPVEIRLDGINQVQVNPKADITFASCLRAILRQDPDVVMIGEIRDLETLEAAIHASITGHLVLSTIHTNSAAATVVRLTEMGAASHLVATALEGVIAQRLVRRLCPDCKTLYFPTEKELRLITSSEEDLELLLSSKLYSPKGCESCNKTGFAGRIGIYEVLPVNREIKKMISRGAADHEIEEMGVNCGMKTLQSGGLNAIINGEIPISEFIRVLGVIND
jgi:type IV pilus assembly protein PilB